MLKRLSQRGYGLFDIAAVTVRHSAYALAYGQVARSVCYMFEGSFGGAMRFVMEQAGRTAEPNCREVACAAHGAGECRFELRCDPV